ncbi:hypothetical protein PIB30_017886 [Stylosanthes scabra]|uniref:Uncharacterized protein n=1 Tax=Stylosanthes scabra TaxID=79078 RepID=A0ABU6Y647_9FABA|nr:hypothetical protein [Stylosanthes scabra]
MAEEKKKVLKNTSRMTKQNREGKEGTYQNKVDKKKLPRRNTADVRKTRGLSTPSLHILKRQNVSGQIEAPPSRNFSQTSATADKRTMSSQTAERRYLRQAPKDHGTDRIRRVRILRPSELGGNYSGYWACLAQVHIRSRLRRPKADGRPKSSSDPYKGPTTSIIGFTRDQNHICVDLVRICSLNNRNHHGYIKRRSALL